MFYPYAVKMNAFMKIRAIYLPYFLVISDSDAFKQSIFFFRKSHNLL